MNEHSNVLILTAGYGDGHLQAANALRNQFHAQGVRGVHVLDLLDEAHPRLNSLIRYMYLKSGSSSSAGFDYYGWGYYSTRNLDHNKWLAKPLLSLGKQKFKQVVRGLQPNAVISTFPYLPVSPLCQKSGMAIPTFTVLTDFALHNRWMISKSDRFYVATKDLKNAMIRRQVQPQQIMVSGIPIREAFYASIDSRLILERHGIDPAKPVVLIMAGAYGILQNMKAILESLSAIENIQLVVVCGKNRKLHQELESGFGQQAQVKLLGYVEAIHEWMRIATCIVTKAGGITLSEAIKLNLPICIFKPFPGQEKENACYLGSKGAALVSGSTTELGEQVKHLLANPYTRKRMKAALARIDSQQQAHAARSIALDVLSIVHRVDERGPSFVSTMDRMTF
ncbi:glycosyltransferase [Paenibacillus sp. J2TS4]|uniref:MGDG synthase family glycosyltransferase n=1 Tax=Paenibacillus sp. J2TS4 TaxID=2807194 RepID=UPI001B00FCAB|nr:glycosyltransferase [Paenibacillus sp. J2TS4]GIP35777.1 processive diacylglycerol beta-glucosyltransferase [Paenibacillus sp. J2TS4]